MSNWLFAKLRVQMCKCSCWDQAEANTEGRQRFWFMRSASNFHSAVQVPSLSLVATSYNTSMIALSAEIMHIDVHNDSDTVFKVW